MISLPQMTLRAGVMIAMIVIVRALALHRLPKRTFTALWLAAALRLLLPFSATVRLDVLPNLPAPSTAFLRGGMAPSNPVLAPAQAMPAAASPARIPSTNLFTLLWGIGFALCTLYFVIAYLRAYQRFRSATPIRNAFIEDWQRSHWSRVRIRLSACVTAPLTYGFFRPVILLPLDTDWSDEATLRFVLAHELTHIRRFDAVRKLCLALAVCLHWFNPMAWVMLVLANRDIELACDEEVLRTLGRHSRGDYARALIKMEEHHSGFAPLCSNFSKNAIEERITSIMKIKKFSIISLLLAVLLVSGMTSAFAVTYSFDTRETSDPAEIDASMRNFVKDYAEFGLSYDAERHDLIYDGKVVRYFEDMWPVYPGNDDERVGRVNEQRDGDIDVYSVRDFTDATTAHPEGVLTGLRVATQKEFDHYTQIRDTMQEAYAEGLFDAVSECVVITNITDEDGDSIQKSAWITMDEDGTVHYMETHPVEMETGVVVEEKTFVFSDDEPETAEATSDSSNLKTGRTFAEIFKDYESIGITFVPGEGSTGNVFYKGVPVRKFSDQKPGGSVFSFESVDGGEIDVSVSYDEDGSMNGVLAQ